MLLQISFGIFTLLLFYLAYFLLSGKVAIFIPTIKIERKKYAETFFLCLGILFIISGLASFILIFYHPIWISFTVLGLVSFFILVFVFGLNFFM